ncbi:MAG: uracil-DNA glycosylase, partial [Actinomycetota bacterium]
VKPDGVVTLGATAGKALLGSKFRVTESRGSVLEAPIDDCDWVVPTVHPSSVLRSERRDEDYAALVSDLEVAAKALAA